MINQSRINTFYIIIVLLFGLLFSRLVYLQVFKFENYRLRSAKIRARVIPNLAPRGQIYDRYKQVLASNKPVFSAYILPVKLEDANKAANVIANILHEDDKKIYAKILHQENKSFEPLLIKDFIDFETISLIEEQGHKLPGFVVGARNIRSYNHGSLAAHILGYIGEIDKSRLKKMTAAGYRPGDIIGLSGVESKYETYLRGKNGGQQIEVDSQGHPIKVLGHIAPVPGNNIALTIDIGLQKLAEDSIGNRRGAVIAMAPQTGEILAMVSKPSFEPELFTAPISIKDWRSLHRKESPLHNRALTAYPPGSVSKIVTTMAALENELVTPEENFMCHGFLNFGNRKADCWTRHRKLNFTNGLVHSCDVVFYNMGLKAGSAMLHKYGSMVGFGQLTGIDIPSEAPGLMPDNAWKKKVYKEAWYPGDSMNLAIGQGFLQTSPLQIAQLMCLVANKGTAYQPHLLKEITSPQETLIHYFSPIETRRITLKESTWEFLASTLKQVVIRGTGQASKIRGIEIAGKTGTAEDPPREDPHAWFASYGPAEKPELVVVVFLEGGGHGGDTAAPIARKIYEYYFEKRKKG